MPAGPCSPDAHCPLCWAPEAPQLSSPHPPAPPACHILSTPSLRTGCAPSQASVWPPVIPSGHPSRWPTWRPTGWRRLSYLPALPLPPHSSLECPQHCLPSDRGPSQGQLLQHLLLSLRGQNGDPSLLPSLLFPHPDPFCVEGLDLIPALHLQSSPLPSCQPGPSPALTSHLAKLHPPSPCLRPHPARPHPILPGSAPPVLALQSSLGVRGHCSSLGQVSAGPFHPAPEPSTEGCPQPTLALLDSSPAPLALNWAPQTVSLQCSPPAMHTGGRPPEATAATLSWVPRWCGSGSGPKKRSERWDGVPPAALGRLGLGGRGPRGHQGAAAARLSAVQVWGRASSRPRRARKPPCRPRPSHPRLRASSLSPL